MSERQNANHITQIKTLFVTVCLVTLTACGGGAGVGGGNQAPDPTVAEKPIAYVKRPTPTMNATPVSGDVTDPEAFNLGAHLIIKMTPSLSATEIDVTDALIGENGDVRDPVFSDDGTKLLFALHKKNVNGQPPETWNIYEYDLNKPLSQATGSENPWLVMDPTIASGGDDIEPQFMPNNRIIFSSTRANDTQPIERDEGTTGFPPTIEQVNSKKHAFNLHSMTDYGNNLQHDNSTDIKQLSYNMSDDLYPTVIRNISGLQGRILFARWEHNPGFNGQLNQMSLYTMNPDGTDVQILYGENSHNTGANNNSQIQYTQPRETTAGNVMVLARQFTGTFDGGDPMLIDVSNYVDNTVPVSASSGLTGPAQTSLSNFSVLTSPGVSLAGRFSSIIPLQDGTSRALVSYSLCYVDVLDTATSTTQTHACSDPSVNLTDPNTTEAPPRYGIFIYNTGDNTVIPITSPQPATYFTDVAMAQGLTAAPYLIDNTDDSAFGTLDIRSVYDMDGTFDGMGSGASLAQLSDPALSTGDKADNPTLIERPARFLRIVKGVYLPDKKLLNYKNSAFGVNSSQLMRQIIGYAPIDPDGSVRVNVPANVPLSISILDKNGRRIGNRHGMWLTVRPGETLSCNGCHNPTSTVPHGRASAEPPSINPGAPTDGYLFPNTAGTFIVNAGDTMAEARTRIQYSDGTNPLLPTPDIVYGDVWTNDPTVRAIDAPFSYSYASLKTTSPANAYCGSTTNWQLCRIIINYEADIQPLWSVARPTFADGDKTCISCHAPDGTNPPAAQLDLSAVASTANTDRFISYQDLLTTHDEVDKNGAPVLKTITNADGSTSMVANSTYLASMSAGSAALSSTFFAKFAPGTTHCSDDGMGTCVPWLSVHELKLLSEWLDIGAQYYNNPFDAPVN
jgi:hypothetical protein